MGAKFVPDRVRSLLFLDLLKVRAQNAVHVIGKLTDRVCKKRGSKRFMAYKIPRACA